MPPMKSLEPLEQQRADLAAQIAVLGDLRAGSVTGTTGRCGKPSCHCHWPDDPGVPAGRLRSRSLSSGLSTD